MSGHGGDVKKPGTAGNTTPSTGTPKHKPVTPFRKGGGKADLSKVPRDENGGILMLEDEVEAAFKFLDVKQTGKVTLLGLKQRFGVFYNSLPIQRIKNMMDGRHNFTLDMMKELVIDNGITDFDPVADAFKVYDRENLGCLSSNALRDLFAEADITELDEEDLQILVESCDLDKDGQVGLEDFRMLGQVAAGGAQALLKNKKAQRRGLNKTNTMRTGGMSMSGRTQRVSFHQTLKNISALADGDFRVLTKPNFLESLEVAGETRLNEVVRKEVLSDPVILRELLRMTVANKFNARRVTDNHRPQRPHSAHPQSKPPPAKTTGRLGEGGDTQTMQQSLRPTVTIRNAPPTVMPEVRRESHAGGGPAVDESGGVIGSLNIEDSGKIDDLEHLLEASLNKQQGRRVSTAVASGGPGGHRGTNAPPPHRGSNAGSGQRPRADSRDSLTDSMKLLELLGSTDHVPSEQGGRRHSSFASSGNGRRRSSASNNGLDMTQSAEQIELLREAGETMALLELLEDKDAGAMGASQGDDFMGSTAKLMSGAR